MSDARTDFFDSGEKAAPASRDDFFDGKVAEPAKTQYEQTLNPYSFLDPSWRRAHGIKDNPKVSGAAGEFATVLHDLSSDPMAAIRAIPTGVNRGVVDLAGLPMDTMVNIQDLGRTAWNAGKEMFTGEAPDNFQPTDRSQVMGTSDYLANLLDSSPLGPVTQLQDQENSAARLAYGAGRAVPGAMTGRQAIAGAAGGGAATVAGEMGADPATQAIAGLAGGKASDHHTQAQLNKAASSQSIGAAGAAVDLQRLSPDLRDAVKLAVQKTGGAVNPEALARQIQADSLPVKVPMSEGQSLGDARIISEERNARAKSPGAVEAYEGQNKALTANLKAFRDTAGEDVFSTNAAEHGDTLIAKYKAIDDARNTDIAAKYKALQDAAGGEFPVDTQALNNNARAALKKQLATNNAPPDVMAMLDEAAKTGKMSLEDFETLRTTLARVQRSAADGQVRHAAGVIRKEVENLPLTEGAGDLKQLADTARSAARERFQALDADPAYKAAVEETTSPDAFVNKFITGKGAYATREQAANMAKAMADDPSAQQTLKVAVLDHLRNSAGIDPSYNGNFSQAGYNKALNALSPRLGSFLDPALVEHTQNLGDVARYTQFQPAGSFVNNSNTFVAFAGDKAKLAAEKAVNMAIPGLDLGTMARERIESAAAARQVKKSWGPGAGLTKLSDLQKLKEPK